MTDTALPAEPARTRKHIWKEVLRVALTALVTFATLVPVIVVVIKNDVDGWLAEMLAQAVLVAGIITKIINIPQIDAWLTTIGIGRASAGLKPATLPADIRKLPPDPPVVAK